MALKVQFIKFSQVKRKLLLLTAELAGSYCPINTSHIANLIRSSLRDTVLVQQSYHEGKCMQEPSNAEVREIL